MFFGGHLNSMYLSNNMLWRVDITQKKLCAEKRFFKTFMFEKEKADKFIFIPCHCQQHPNQW